MRFCGHFAYMRGRGWIRQNWRRPRSPVLLRAGHFRWSGSARTAAQAAARAPRAGLLRAPTSRSVLRPVFLPPARPDAMRINVLREALDNNQGSLGCRVASSWPAMIELLGYSGQFDYPEFLAEYAPYDLYSLDNIGRAVHMFPHMTGMAKLDQAGRLYWGPRISGAGIQNILWADPRTVEDVEECVKAMRYEGPESKYPGLHGVGMRRDVGFVLEGASLAALEGGDDGVCAIMIEKRQAVEDLQSLLSVPGVDMVQFGPSDYAMSMGVTGQGPNHPKVKEGELKTIKTAIRMGIEPRVEMSFADEKTIIEYQDLGVKHWCMGPDTVVWFNYLTSEGAKVNKLMGRDPPGPLGYGQARPGVKMGSPYGGNTIGDVSANKTAGFSGGSFTPPMGQKAGAKI